MEKLRSQTQDGERLKVSNWPETTAALGRKAAGEGGFIRAQSSGPVRRSQNQGGGFQGAGITEAGSFVGEETSWERSSHSQGPHRKRKEQELSQPLPSSCSLTICLLLANLPRRLWAKEPED